MHIERLRASRPSPPRNRRGNASAARRNQKVVRLSDTIHMALIGRIPDRSSILKRGIKGTLLATSEKVSFVPFSQAAKFREVTYDELNYVEVKGILGWRSLVFHTEDTDVSIRCVASARETIAFYDFVNERISAAQGSSTFGARYFLTQLRAEGGLYRYQEELDPQTALDVLFDETEAPLPVLESTALKSNVPGGHPLAADGYSTPKRKDEDQKSADRFEDELTFLTTLYNRPAVSSRKARPLKKIAPAETKARTRWSIVVPVSALIALELWWLFGLATGNPRAVDVASRSSKSSASTDNQIVDEGNRGPLARRRVGDGAMVIATHGTHEPELVEEDAVIRLLNKRSQLGKVLAAQRIYLGMSQQDIARAINKDSSFIDEIENGTRSMQLPELLAILRALQLDAGTAVERVANQK